VRVTGHAAWIGLLAAPAAAARGVELEEVTIDPPAIRAALLRGEISPRLDAVLELCAAGSALAVLPRVLARPRGLRALRGPALPPSQLYLVSRVPLGQSPLAPLFADIRDRARRALE
jgi:DNA-binding transcriptional LysR family regulator